ncbi:EthD family reductase [Halomonas alkalisoli]|uniref:EthD family reductase n=1 Tax=Halomonas alkalisoli TaxID=2907158 RepID=UPI001F2062C6|nr:EthD family reductase [Halomonas alkalisoli]MCE9683359.1 EthD family reductase [Halomonas alkalisoli]
MIEVLVMYANRDGMRFDDTYYFKEHADLVKRLLQSYGLNYIRIARGTDAKSPYYAVTYLGIDSLVSFKAAIDAIGSTLFEDIPRFTDVEPLIQVSQVVWEKELG